MENKRLTRKLNSIFWWVLMAMPLWALLFGLISVIKLSSNDTILSQWNYDEIYGIIQSEEWFNENSLANIMNSSSIPTLQNVFRGLMQVLNVNTNYQWNVFLVNCLAWSLSVKIYHLIFDFLAFIFDWLHDFFERG